MLRSDSPETILSNASIVVVVAYKIHSGVRDQFLRLAMQHATRVLQTEPGCLLYQVAPYLTLSPDLIIFTEVYVSSEAFDTHQKSEVLADFRKNRTELVAEVFHRIWDSSLS